MLWLKGGSRKRASVAMFDTLTSLDRTTISIQSHDRSASPQRINTANKLISERLSGCGAQLLLLCILLTHVEGSELTQLCLTRDSMRLPCAVNTAEDPDERSNSIVSWLNLSRFRLTSCSDKMVPAVKLRWPAMSMRSNFPATLHSARLHPQT